MTQQDVLELLTKKLEKMEACHACRNLMGKYSYYHTASRNREFVELWAKRGDDLLVMPWGEYEGFNGIKACYVEDHGDRSDPAILERLRGGVFMHEMDTEILQVAEDGMTAKGSWLSPGHETYVDREPGGDGKAHAEWAFSKYAVDFIKEDGVWKFWHMRLYPIFKGDYGKSWVDYPQPNPDDFPPSHATKPSPKAWAYQTDQLYPANEPPIPMPYKTFADVGITFEH
jgi:hypothetical protein